MEVNCVGLFNSSTYIWGDVWEKKTIFTSCDVVSGHAQLKQFWEGYLFD